MPARHCCRTTARIATRRTTHVCTAKADRQAQDEPTSSAAKPAAGLLFVLPWLLGLLIFTAYPVFATFFLAFTDYSVIEAPRWVGLENFQTMFSSDPSFGVSVYNSAYYALISVPLGLVVALGLAIVLNQRARGIGIYRTLVLPAVARAARRRHARLSRHVRALRRADQHAPALGRPPAPAWF